MYITGLSAAIYILPSSGTVVHNLDSAGSSVINYRSKSVVSCDLAKRLQSCGLVECRPQCLQLGQQLWFYGQFSGDLVGCSMMKRLTALKCDAQKMCVDQSRAEPGCIDQGTREDFFGLFSKQQTAHGLDGRAWCAAACIKRP